MQGVDHKPAAFIELPVQGVDHKPAAFIELPVQGVDHEPAAFIELSVQCSNKGATASMSYPIDHNYKSLVWKVRWRCFAVCNLLCNLFFNNNRYYDNFTKEVNKLLKFIFFVLHDLCAEVMFLLLLLFFYFM